MKKTLFATPQDAEAAFYEALVKRDLEAMMEVWADDDDSYCVHPGGVRVSGVERIRESWRRIFASGQDLRFSLRDQQMIHTMMLAVHSVYEHISGYEPGFSRVPQAPRSSGRGRARRSGCGRTPDSASVRCERLSQT